MEGAGEEQGVGGRIKLKILSARNVWGKVYLKMTYSYKLHSNTSNELSDNYVFCF